MTKTINGKCGKCKAFKINNCTNCGKEIKGMGVMSPTLNKKHRNVCLDCGKKVFTYPELEENLSYKLANEIDTKNKIIRSLTDQIINLEFKGYDYEEVLFDEAEKNMNLKNRYDMLKLDSETEISNHYRYKQTWKLVSIIFLIGFLIMGWIAL
jgi:DNA-directed RNA polymerase subunit RPC12/RpoP